MVANSSFSSTFKNQSTTAMEAYEFVSSNLNLTQAVVIAAVVTAFTPFFFVVPRGNSLSESWDTTFLPDWQLPIIFVRVNPKSYER